MKTRRLIVALTAGASLTVAPGCGKGEPPTEVMTYNPPMLAPEPAPNAGLAGNPPLPTWDESTSGHPEGATNPPQPVLTVDPSGRCYKRWIDPRQQAIEVVTECKDTECGAEVQCPERAAGMLAEWKANTP